MSSKKEEKSQDAADKIKAATLSAAKGLSRAQAERAAAAAARNVNAYGQKEEGPSRWQERKEAKRQMYLMSTEKAVKLGVRKDLKMSTISSTASQCQKCFQPGHWTYECKNERVYISRPSRSQQLKNPKLRQKPLSPTELDEADARKEPDQEKEQNHEEDMKHRKKSKRKHRSDDESRSDSEASVFDSQSESSAAESDYSSEESASSYSSSSDSEEERRRRKRKKNKKQKKGRKKRYSSSSESSDSESMSDSDSDDKGSRRKSKSRSSRRR